MTTVKRTKPQPLMKAQELHTVASKTDTFNPVSNLKVAPSRGTQFLKKMNQIIPGVATAGASVLQKAVEKDKLRQENRALAGLEPSSDATKAGRATHALVDVRNSGNESGRKLIHFASTFEGTDADYNAGMAKIQSDYLELVGSSDPAHIKIAGEVFRDALPKAAEARYKQKQIQQQKAQYETIRNSLKEAMNSDFTSDQHKKNLAAVMDEKTAMGASSETFRKALVDEAISAASEGNLTLLNYTKQLGIFRREPGLIMAENRASKSILAKNSGAVAMEKKALTDQLGNSPLMTFEEFAARTEKQKAPNGNSLWTPSQIKSAWDSNMIKRKVKFRGDKLFSMSMDKSLHPERTPVAFFNPSDKEEEALVTDYNKVFGDMERDQISKTNDPAEQQAIKSYFMDQKATWLADNGLVDKAWKDQFKALESIDLDAVNPTQKLPEGIAVALSHFDDLASHPGTLATMATDNGISIYQNFKKGLSYGYTEPQALIEALKISRGDTDSMSSTDIKEVKASVSNALDTEFNSGMWTTVFLAGKPDMRKQQAEILTEEVSERARDLMLAKVPREDAISRAVAESKDIYTKLDSGVLVKGKLPLIASEMGVEAGKVSNIIATFPSYVMDLSDKEGFEDVIINSSTDTPPEKWIPRINTAKGTITFTDEYGTPVVRTFTLAELAGISLNKQAEIHAKEEDVIDAQYERHMERLRKGEGAYWPIDNVKKEETPQAWHWPTPAKIPLSRLETTNGSEKVNN